VGNAQAGYYDDGAGRKRWWDGEKWTDDYQPLAEAGGGGTYVVLQVILKERLWGTGSGNLTELEKAINHQAAQGYRLHTITTASSGSKGLGGGDRIQATMIFERLT
jgi:hypothetical protein